VAPSKQKVDPRRIRAALTLTKSSVPKIARAYGCSDKTLYAVLDGARPGNNKNVRKAVAFMEQLVGEVLSA